MLCDLLAMDVLMGCPRSAKHGRADEVCAQTRQVIPLWRCHRWGRASQLPVYRLVMLFHVSTDNPGPKVQADEVVAWTKQYTKSIARTCRPSSPILHSTQDR